MKFFKWIKASFEGVDRRASGRKLTIFVFTIMYVITWAANLFFGKFIDPIILSVMGIFILVGWGILTAQNIVDILKNPRDPNENIYKSDNSDFIPPTE